MSVRAEKNGVWQFGHGSSDYKNDIEEIKQNIITTLRSWKWDCFFDLEAGIDWKTYLGSYGTENELKNNIIKELQKINGVIDIVEYENYIDEERKINISMKIKTIYGNIDILENVNNINNK